MNEEIKAIAQRVKELREILELSIESMAQTLNVSIEEYESYENGEVDMPVSVLYGIARILKIDPTELMTGESPKMAQYSVVKKNEGVTIERYLGYKFTSLAVNIKDRAMDPMIVTVKKDKAKAQLFTHKGQEFNYVLKGKIIVRLGTKEIELCEGDSVYFDSTIPHLQKAVTEEAVFLTVINECSAN